MNDEYISKQKVLDYLNGYLHSLGEGGADTLLFDRGQRRALINSIQDISAVKAADVQPVKRGKWKHVAGMNSKCSVCSHYFPVTEFDSRPFDINFCPQCGARIGGDSE